MRWPRLFRRDAGEQVMEVEGVIQDLRVVQVDGRDYWAFHLDSHADVEFWFEVSALTKPRRVGERVRVAYRSDGTPGRLTAGWIVSAV
jgi:hypothetical protein